MSLFRHTAVISRNYSRFFFLAMISLGGAWLESRPLIAQEEPTEVLLWSDPVPGGLGTEAKDRPRFTLYPVARPEVNSGPAILICPGGGYGGLAMDHEGVQIAAWMNSLGVTAAILDYRHRGKGYGHPIPLQDCQRGIRTLRARAKEWSIDPAKIGVIGFSAGGHLASTAATQFDAPVGLRENDTIDGVSSRPDFAILCYPVIAFGQSYTHQGSQHNLLGKDAPPALVTSMSSERRVTKQTPPTFLFHTGEDTAVPPQNSIEFYLALLRHDVPAELHIYEQGRHGVGLARDLPHVREWSVQCENWLRNRKIIAEH